MNPWHKPFVAMQGLSNDVRMGESEIKNILSVKKP